MPDTPAQRFADRLLRAAATDDFTALNQLIADQVVFHTPRFLKPITSRPHMLAVLRSIPVVIEGFHYERHWISAPQVIMEFKGKIGDIIIHGLDIFTIGDDGRAFELTVFLRPTKALQAVGEAEDRLARASGLTTGSGSVP